MVSSANFRTVLFMSGIAVMGVQREQEGAEHTALGGSGAVVCTSVVYSKLCKLLLQPNGNGILVNIIIRNKLFVMALYFAYIVNKSRYLL